MKFTEALLINKHENKPVKPVHLTVCVLCKVPCAVCITSDEVPNDLSGRLYHLEVMLKQLNTDLERVRIFCSSPFLAYNEQFKVESNIISIH